MNIRLVHMAYSASLADRVRQSLRGTRGVVEKKMFGGLAFLTHGHMTVGVIRDDLIVRIAPDATASTLTEPGVREFAFTGRPMKGWVVADGESLDDDVLDRWINRGLAYVGTLPPK